IPSERILAFMASSIGSVACCAPAAAAKVTTTSGASQRVRTSMRNSWGAVGESINVVTTDGPAVLTNPAHGRRADAGQGGATARTHSLFRLRAVASSSTDHGPRTTEYGPRTTDHGHGPRSTDP